MGVTCVHEVVGGDSGSTVLRLGVDDCSMLLSDVLLLALAVRREEFLTRCRARSAPSISVMSGSSGIGGIAGATGAGEGFLLGKVPLSGYSKACLSSSSSITRPRSSNSPCGPFGKLARISAPTSYSSSSKLGSSGRAGAASLMLPCGPGRSGAQRENIALSSFDRSSSYVCSSGCAGIGLPPGVSASLSTFSMAAAIMRAASSLDVCDCRATFAFRSALDERSHVELGGVDMAR